MPRGRYVHGPSYVVTCATDAGLEVVLSETIPLRREQGVWLEGGRFVLTRPA